MRQERSSGDTRGDSGFTLIEVLVALLVMIIGLTGVVMMQAAAVRGNRDATRFTRAAMLAEDGMEELRGRSVATLEADETVEQPEGYWRSETVAGVEYLVAYSVDDVSGQPNLVRVTVTVSYADEGDETAPRSVQVQTIRSRPEAL